MKKFISLIITTTISIALMAIPALRKPATIHQPDGSTIQVIQHGDEHFHYLTNTNGEWLTKDANGYYVVTSPMSQQEIEKHRLESPKLKSQILRAQQKTPIVRNISPRGVIILVNFKDVTFQTANTLSAMQEMHNGDNYTYNGATGSARKYFQDQSNGRYNPQFDIVGPVTVSENRAYYGENDNRGDDKNPGEMIAEACRLANKDWNIDFSQYDNNNDGVVDFVYIIYAGKSEAEAHIENYIWPHAYTLDDAGVSCSVNGKKINSYACSSELNYDNKRSGIGTFCHEFSHVCGLPDLYATNGATHKTLGEWDILDYGSYSNEGRTPPSYSAYERFFCGWLTPTYISSAANLTLGDLQSSNKAYIITENEEPNLIGYDPKPTTFYLLENRQQNGWDKYLPGHGMMITKVQYDYIKWTKNTTNNSSNNQSVDIIEADGSTPALDYRNIENGYYGKAKDLFPAGAASYTAITNREITEISENNGAISFKFMGGSEGTEGGDEPAKDYDIVFKSSDSGGDVSITISDPTINKLIEKGAELLESVNILDKVYMGKTGLKIGNSSNGGSVILSLTKEITLGKITLLAKPYGKDAPDITINGVSQTVSTEKDYTFEFNNIKTSNITISTSGSKQRAYIMALNIETVITESFTVTFVDYKGEVIGTQVVAKGESAEIPDNIPTREGYKFIGWDTGLSNVQNDMIVKAKYAKTLIGNKTDGTTYEFIIRNNCE